MTVGGDARGIPTKRYCSGNEDRSLRGVAGRLRRTAEGDIRCVCGQDLDSGAALAKGPMEIVILPDANAVARTAARPRTSSKRASRRVAPRRPGRSLASRPVRVRSGPTASSYADFRDGHIGFNGSMSSLGSRTRVKTLTEQTRRDNARFFPRPEGIPHHVLAHGLATIRDAGHILPLGEAQAETIAAAVEGPLAAACQASSLQLHPTRPSSSTATLPHASTTASTTSTPSPRSPNGRPAEPRSPIAHELYGRSRPTPAHPDGTPARRWAVNALRSGSAVSVIQSTRVARLPARTSACSGSPARLWRQSGSTVRS